MSTSLAQPAVPTDGAARRGHHPGLALAVIAGAQLMVVLDATIVNVALPHVQTALNFSTTDLSWVLNAYSLTFGGLLLLGGRAGDIFGRRRVFMTGILLFVLASFLGGLATTSWWLLAARALQGVGAAIASPTALSLITTNFAAGKERNRAFGVFSAVSGSGAAVGLLAGGVLTSWLSWRWVLFVNVPIGVLIAVLAPLYINESQRRPGRVDMGGALTSTAGMTVLVYGFIRAAQQGWGDPWTIASFGAAIVLLAVFVGIERAHPQPVVPLHMFRNRNRTGSYVVMLALAASLFSMFFFLTLFVQNVLGYSPLRSGIVFLPVSAAIVVTAGITSQLLIRVGPKPFMVLGAILATGGLAWLSQISTTSSYLGGILGPIVLFAAGMGFLFVPLTVIAVSGVAEAESGAASGMLNVTQQVGGSLGLSILVTVFGTAARNEQQNQISTFLAAATPQMRADFAAGRLAPPAGIGNAVLAHGISTAFEVGVVFAAIALLATILVIRTRASDAGARLGPDVASAVTRVAARAPGARAGVPGVRAAGRQPDALPEQHLPEQHLPEQHLPELVGVGAGGGFVDGHPGRNGAPPADGAGGGLVGGRTAAPAFAPALAGAGHAAVAGHASGAGHAGGAAPHVEIEPTAAAAAPGAAAAADRQPSSPAVLGRVSHAGGGWMDGATVTLTDLSGQQLDRAHTDVGGDYRLTPPGAGTYLVICAAGSHQPNAHLVEVADRPVRHDIALAIDGASLTGSVQVAGRRPPAEPAGVALTLTDDQGSVTATTAADARGGYRFDELPAGRYTLTAAAHGFSPVATTVTLSAQAPAHLDLELAAPARLTGRVESATFSGAVAEALVTLVDDSGTVTASAVTDAQGRFDFDDLADGSYTLTATGYLPVATVIHIVSGDDTEAVLTLSPPAVG